MSRHRHPKHEGLEDFHMYPQLTIFVRDLPFCCDAIKLQQFFTMQLSQPVVRAKVCCNRLGKTLQYGYVMFESEDVAREAIERLQGARFIGRDIR
jgi:RNA recognition motif-containing protein